MDDRLEVVMPCSTAESSHYVLHDTCVPLPSWHVYSHSLYTAAIHMSSHAD